MAKATDWVYKQDNHTHHSLLQLCSIKAVCQIEQTEQIEQLRSCFGKQALNSGNSRPCSNCGADAVQKSVCNKFANAAWSLIPYL